MKTLAFAAVASFLFGAAPASAAPAFDCAGTGRASFETVCADPELVRLDRAIDAALGRRLAAADPLSRLLLKRDQRWFAEVLGGKDADPFGPDDPRRKRLVEALLARQAVVDRLGVVSADHPAGAWAGAWANVFASAKVERQADGVLAVAVRGKSAYAEADGETVCGVRAQVKLDANGWFAGPARRIDGDAPRDDAGQSPFELRLRLQGNTLRIVLMPSEQDTICATAEQITGSYFALGTDGGPSAPAAVARRTVAPSFSCATAKGADEEEICADPELAARDVEIARAYRDALRALDARSAAFLRADQRAFVKENAAAFETYLNPPWNKQSYYVHHVGAARNELHLRLRDRLAMLGNLEPRRRGMAGVWVGHNALLVIEPSREEAGVFRAAGFKWETGDYKSHCKFEADGRLMGGTLQTDESFPLLARDGATLTIDGNDPDPPRDRNGNRRREQPDYCSRMNSAKARLFPVKAGAPIDLTDGRIR